MTPGVVCCFPAQAKDGLEWGTRLPPTLVDEVPQRLKPLSLEKALKSQA